MITTIDSLLREVWRYEPEILNRIFQLMFVPCHKDVIGKNKYIEVIPQKGSNYIDYVAINSLYLNAVIISNKVTNIGHSSFDTCTLLSYIYIPESVKTIKSGAFWCCHSLENVNIPNSVEYIDEYSFFSCSKLKKIFIPDSVREIGYNAFMECSKLEYAYINKNLEEMVLGNEVFPITTKIIVR